MSVTRTKRSPSNGPLSVAPGFVTGGDQSTVSGSWRGPAPVPDGVATHPPRVVFRRLCADDVEHCFPTSGRAIAEDWLAQQARDDMYVAVAEVDGMPIGRRGLDFTYYPHLHVGYCFAATVRPEWRSRGIGSMLDAHMEEVARARGLRAFRCVVVKQNQRARSWHERLGYREIGTTLARWTELDGREVEHHCWVLERQFEPPHP